MEKRAGTGSGGAVLGSSPLVLIVEDEADIVAMLADYFAIQGYRTSIARDAASALEAVASAPSVILLDVNLPDGDGFDVCRRIRERVVCPIIFLTARVEEADEIMGFAAGGDDYVTKPFSLEALGARVKAQIARDKRSVDGAVVGFSGGVSIDFARREARVEGRLVELARKDFAIVELLAKRPGQVFDRDMVHDLAWDEPGDSAVVTEHIRRIRRAFSQAGCTEDPIATVWGVGYSWKA